MNVVALITWFRAVAGGLLLLAARLVEYTRDFQGCGCHAPACVSDLRPGPGRRARSDSVWHGGMT
jgi:hypothetical protein